MVTVPSATSRTNQKDRRVTTNTDPGLPTLDVKRIANAFWEEFLEMWGDPSDGISTAARKAVIGGALDRYLGTVGSPSIVAALEAIIPPSCDDCGHTWNSHTMGGTCYGGAFPSSSPSLNGTHPAAGLNASEPAPTGERHYHGDTLYDRAIECYDVHGDTSESGQQEPSDD